MQLRHTFNFAILLAGLALGIWMIESYVTRELSAAHQLERERTLSQLAEFRGELEQTVTSTAYLAHGLVGFLRAVEQPIPRQVRSALSAIYEHDPIIRNIGLAPNNVMTYIYPLEGNEAAIGLNLAKHPVQRQSVILAIESGNSILAGPVDLVQGGRALINRTPVNREDGSYWGLISIVIDLDELLTVGGLPHHLESLELALHSEGLPESDSPWIIGQAPGLQDDALHMRIAVPGGAWVLQARPRGGWHSYDTLQIKLRTIMYGILLILLGSVLSLMRSQTLASRLAGTLSISNEALEHLSRFDPLTNVANRRYFEEVLRHSWATCQRNRIPISILMLDVDHFKSINDAHGHETGDKCLVQVAGIIKASLEREGDFVARYGGEEFVVIEPSADVAQALALGEKIRKAIADKPILANTTDAAGFRITISVGVASHHGGENDTTAEDLCRRADQALYAAKNSGRNQVQYFDQLGL